MRSAAQSPCLSCPVRAPEYVALLNGLAVSDRRNTKPRNNTTCSQGSMLMVQAQMSQHWRIHCNHGQSEPSSEARRFEHRTEELEYDVGSIQVKQSGRNKGRDSRAIGINESAIRDRVRLSMPISVGSIATTWKGTTYAVAATNSCVEVWDLGRARRISTFRTCYDDGGSRVAMSPTASEVLVGSYEARTIALHHADNGLQLWSRTHARHIHTVGFDPTNGDALVCMDGGGVSRIDVSSGGTLTAYRGLLRFDVSPLHSNLALTESADTMSLVRRRSGKRLWEIDKHSFGVLSVAFTPQLVCVSEAASCLRGVDIETGKTKWRVDPEPGSHLVNRGIHLSRRLCSACCIIMRRPASAGS